MPKTVIALDLPAEMAAAEFGDARLSRRLGKIVASIADGPAQSFPTMFDDTELEGAYRFFNNQAVSSGRILAPHVAATHGRMAGHATVLVVHDTSTMAFSPDGARRGLGRIRSAGQAFFAHVSLALSGDGSRLPLGVLALSTRIREGQAKSRKKGKARTRHVSVDNERDRWGEQVAAVGAGVDRTRVVHLMDREADDYALFAQMIEAGDRFVVRLSHDRLLAPTADGGRKLADAVGRIRARAEREVPLSRRSSAPRSPKQKRIHPPRERRVAKLAFGATTVMLRRPADQPKTLPTVLTVHVARVWEVDTPAGESPVEWLLVTTEPLDSPEQILQVVDWYRARWVIEELFKAIKTGCAYDTRQLETLDGLVNVLATCLPIAWRMLRMRTLARQAPDAPGTLALPSPMIQVLRGFTRIDLPKNPSAREVLLAVAALGGHLKHNGEPGWLTLRRGYEKLRTLTQGVAFRDGVAWTDV